ncbi:uncharacterized protein LTR77_004623 [Saxophila tyrrhenica]|uniref:Aminoglycoside phosphotransferase domain-containing protein n=1 Tax=Saxophila tyrrhenica TaxID=1690608 RepID=A0AAV9PHF9_9PEZI|nr:hypothetical protein LTR77_004623 [Saxophila tyrrhenica]
MDSPISRPATSQSDTRSTSSTDKYQHEPFETFKEKILALSTGIRASSIDDLRRMQGGSYNRVVLAHVNWKPGALTPPNVNEVIFRMPRQPDEEDVSEAVQSQVAVMKFVRQHGIPVAEVIEFDATVDNAICSPYTVLSYVDAPRLDQVYDDMSLNEKLHFVTQYKHILAQLEEVQFPRAGSLHCTEEAVHVVHWCWANSSGPYHVEADAESCSVHLSRRRASDGSDVGKSALSLIEAQLAERQAQLDDDIETGQHVEYKKEYFDRLQRICVQMRQDKRYSRAWQEDVSVLHHWDLEPRNILVQHEDEGTRSRWKIKAVLDWDDALAVPTILTRKPAIWRWDRSCLHSSLTPPDKFFDWDADTLQPDHYSGLTGEPQIVKQRFEALYRNQVISINGKWDIEEYVDVAYQTGRWLRNLERFTMCTFSEKSEVDLLDRMELE